MSLEKIPKNLMDDLYELAKKHELNMQGIRKYSNSISVDFGTE